jgi:tetratricopeptide (TPR) repeat protein
MKILPALAVTAILGAGVPVAAQDDPRSLMLQARAMQRRGGGDNPQGAITLYRKVVAQMPTSSQAHLRLSEALLEAGSVNAAIDPAQQAAELDPKSGEAWAHLGLLQYFRSQNNPAARGPAVAALRHAVKLLPSDPELWTRLGEVQETLNDDEGALKAWLSVGRLRAMATYRGRPLADFAWERALELAVKLKQYESRREAVLALCDKPNPDQRALKFLEDLARDQVEAGFLGHAEDSFKLLAQYFPQEPAIWENIAIVQLRTNRFEPALATLDKVEGMRRSTRISFNVGLCLMKLGRFEEAQGRWRQMLANPGTTTEDLAFQPSVKVLYATCLLLLGHPQDMLDLSGPWPESASHPEMLARRAQALIQTGAWKPARTALKEGIARFPDQDLFTRARELPPKLFEEGVFFKNESRQALVQLNLETMAGIYAEFHCWERCLDLVQQARKAAPVRDVELLLLEANALESLDRSDQAMKVLREGQKLNPNHPTLQNNLGFILLERGGDLEEASRLIAAALAREPRNSSTMDSWGWVLFKKGRYKEAEAALRQAAEISPFSPEIHRHLGEALLKLERLQEALEEWDRALAFAFPDRRTLEQQAQDLRTRLAKSRAAAPVDEPKPEERVDEDDLEPPPAVPDLQ